MISDEDSELIRNSPHAGWLALSVRAVSREQKIVELELALGDERLVRVPVGFFTEDTQTLSWSKVVPDFTDPQVIDCGQTIKLGPYEIGIDVILENWG